MRSTAFVAKTLPFPCGHQVAAQDELLLRATKTKVPDKMLDKLAKTFEAERAKEEVRLQTHCLSLRFHCLQLPFRELSHCVSLRRPKTLPHDWSVSARCLTG